MGITTPYGLNTDIAGIINGSQGANAAKLTFLYQLASYRTVDEEQLEDTVSNTFSDRTASTDDLQEPDLEHNVEAVKGALFDKLNLDAENIQVTDMISAVLEAGTRVFREQVKHIHSNVNLANVNAIIDTVESTVRNAEIMTADTTTIDAYLIKSRDIFDSVEFSGASSAVFDVATKNALFNMLKPWLIFWFLAEFIPGTTDRSGKFKPNYQDTQYARLAMFRATFDIATELQRYLQDADSTNREDIDKLGAISLKIADTIGTEYVTPRKNKYPEWQQNVASRSSDTKTMSMKLYQVNAQLEKRKANLQAMLQNYRELQKESTRRTWLFRVVMIIYALIVLSMIFLIAFGRYSTLYMLCGVVIVVPVLYFVINLVQKTIR